MFNLKDQKALITGGSRGIGEKLAEKFIQAGAQVVIVGTNQERLEAVKRRLGSNCEFAVANLADNGDIENLIKNYCSDIDILVNNAGTTKDGLLMRMGDDSWNEVLNINLTSAFKLIKGSIRTMMKKKYGRIINMSSVVASSGNPGQANYCAAKAGMIGMTKSIALEVASRGITANVISPGFIATDMTKKLTEEQSNNIIKNIPQQKMGTADDIAYTAIFLASKESSYITGQNFHVNGGLYLA
jgi:3-oxoacyl-[acyl-carrier protein] reductase